MVSKVALVACLMAAAAAADPFAFLAPSVMVTDDERMTLARGDVVARALDAHRGQVAVLAVVRTTADPAVLVSATRDIGRLKKSRFVSAIERFSDPPELSDLDALVLSERDRQALKDCEVGKCSFKLAAIEIEALRRQRYGDVDGDRVTAAFRQVLLDRVQAYQASGLASLPPVANRPKPWRLDEVAAALEAQSPPVPRAPRLDTWQRDRQGANGQRESFLYWSQEWYGSGKPVILVTHVVIHQDRPDQALVVGRQIFASRYMNGGLSLTAITTDAAGTRYLAYLNRSAVDLLGGVFGGFARSMLQSRLARDVPELVLKLRDRLERNSHASSSDSLRHE